MEPTERRIVTRRLLHRALRHRGILVLSLLTMLVAGLTDTAPIVLAKVFVDHVLLQTNDRGDSFLDRTVEHLVRSATAGDPDPTDPRLVVAGWVAMAMLVLAVLAAASTYANEFIAKYLASLVTRDLRVDMLRSAVRFPYGWFTRRKMGDIVSRFSNDATTTFQTINIFVSELLLQPFILVGCLTSAILINWRLAVFSLVFFPLLVYPVLRLGRRVHKRSKKTLVSLGETMEAMNQTLTGLRVVKAFRMEEEEVADYARVNDEWLHRQVSLVKAKALGRSLMDLIWGAVLALLVYGGSRFLVERTWELRPGDFAAFLTAFAAAYRPIKRLSVAYNTWLASLAAAGRVFEVVDAPPEPPDPPGAKRIGPVSDAVVFDKVRFAYSDEETGEGPPVLRDFSLRIGAHEVVAIVGASGAGKSTVANLLLRFYEPTEGRILVDGIPLAEVSRESLLAQIALVSQHPFLFNTTIRENIAYGRPGASEAQIVAAATAANIHEDILRMPKGYDTVVGERGATLSGGQLQRITIARAILRDASILVLDEATSSLDTQSERAVQAALDNLLRGKTAIVIAHRLSTIVNADRIVVLEGGRIVETGRHAELLAGNGSYAALYRTQAG